MEILPFMPDAYCLSYYKDKHDVDILYPEPPLGWCEKEVLDEIKGKITLIPQHYNLTLFISS